MKRLLPLCLYFCRNGTANYLLTHPIKEACIWRCFPWDALNILPSSQLIGCGIFKIVLLLREFL
jgi:hypothetical protein